MEICPTGDDVGMREAVIRAIENLPSDFAEALDFINTIGANDYRNNFESHSDEDKGLSTAQRALRTFMALKTFLRSKQSRSEAAAQSQSQSYRESSGCIGAATASTAGGGIGFGRGDDGPTIAFTQDNAAWTQHAGNQSFGGGGFGFGRGGDFGGDFTQDSTPPTQKIFATRPTFSQAKKKDTKQERDFQDIKKNGVPVFVMLCPNHIKETRPSIDPRSIPGEIMAWLSSAWRNRCGATRRCHSRRGR